jgi:hypothetical protein
MFVEVMHMADFMLFGKDLVEVLDNSALPLVRNITTGEEFYISRGKLKTPPTPKAPRLSLIDQHRKAGHFIEYVNAEERECVPYVAERNPEAHQFLMDTVRAQFADGQASIEVHAPLGHPTIAAELAGLMAVDVTEAEQHIIWGQGGAKGEAHSATYNLHLANPNRLGLDDDLQTNLNHRHGLARVQIGKQDLVKQVIALGFHPEKRN